MLKRLFLSGLICFGLINLAIVLNVIAKHYAPIFINVSFFFAGMIYEWFLIKRIGQ